MQEEVESRTVNLAVTTTKLTARTVIAAGLMYLRHREKVKGQKASEIPSGKQSVKDLIGQNQGVSSIDIAKTDLRGFEGVARKYGVDYAIRSHEPVQKAERPEAAEVHCGEDRGASRQGREPR